MPNLYTTEAEGAFAKTSKSVQVLPIGWQPTVSPPPPIPLAQKVDANTAFTGMQMEEH